MAPTATAASKAFPPFSSICSPADEAIGWPAVTRPCSPATAGRVVHATIGRGRFGGLLLREQRDTAR